MKPDKEGIWEWVDHHGKTQLVAVYNVSSPLNDVHLRVGWWGGYYDVDGEWPDTWGKFVGEIGSVPDEQLYLMPNKEEREEIKKRYEN